MYLLRYQNGPFRYKHVPFEKVPAQWLLLYLYFWEWRSLEVWDDDLAYIEVCMSLLWSERVRQYILHAGTTILVHINAGCLFSQHVNLTKYYIMKVSWSQSLWFHFPLISENGTSDALQDVPLAQSLFPLNLSGYVFSIKASTAGYTIIANSLVCSFNLCVRH